MAATVRIARILASTAPATSKATATSSGGQSSGALVRIAGITASTVSSTAVVRIAGITAVSGQSAATVRIADIRAFSPTATYVWDGAGWILTSPTGVGLSSGRATSAGSGGVAATGAGTGSAKATSSGTGIPAFSGTLSLAGGGTLQPSGAQTSPGNAAGNLNLSGSGTLTLTGSAVMGPPGAGSLTVILDPANKPPRVLLELTGALGTQVTINRIDQAGNRVPVRQANPATLNAGAAVAYDYECPFGQTVRYEALTSGPTITSDPVVLAVGQSWLIHPGIPSLSLPIDAKAPSTRTRAARQGVFEVIGRSTPLVRTDSPRRAPTSTLVVKVFGQDQVRALEALLADNSVLLLQLANAGRARTDYAWISVGDVTEDDITQGYPDDPYEWWTLPYTVTDAPSGLLQSQRTWRDVVAEFATWRDLLNAYGSWRDVITDNRIDS